jgi:hypothetical protein
MSSPLAPVLDASVTNSDPARTPLTSRTWLVVAFFACALLYISAPDRGSVRPVGAPASATIEGTFALGGVYPGEPFPYGSELRAWGSWSGSDENVGRLALGPFPAPRILHLAVSGYPGHAGNQLFLEQVATRARHPITAKPAGERWEMVAVSLPADWTNSPVVLVASDDARDKFGWLGVTEPLDVSSVNDHAAFYQALAAWAINGLMLALLWQAALHRLAPRNWVPSPWLPLVAGGVVAVAGYVAFFVYLVNASAGKIFSLLLIAAAARDAWKRKDAAAFPGESLPVAKLMLAIGAFYLALLHLYPTSRGFEGLAANRYRENLPGDNTLPFNLASTLYEGHSARTPGGEWQSSDRPPLQSGWQLLTWPVTWALRLESRMAAGTSAVWFQLFWVASAFGLLRALGVELRRAMAWTAVISLSGFFVQNTVFTWPKLSAGALTCAAFGLWVLARAPTGSAPRRPEIFTGAALAALGWLSHGGVAFSLLALAPWLLWRALRGEWRTWCLAAGVFLLVAGPWLCYQKFYDPPGTRLLKLHLAGQDELTPRGVGEEIRAAYAPLSAREILARKLKNFEYQVGGDWSSLFQFSPAEASRRRQDEFFLTGRALTWWLLGLAAWPVIFLRLKSRQRFDASGRGHIALALWILVTIPIWCALMWQFAVVHQGSYALMIALFVLLTALLEIAAPWTLAMVAGLQAVTLATTYAVPNAVIGGRPIGLPLVLVTGLVLAGFVAGGMLPREPTAWANLKHALARRARTFVEALRAWWLAPRLNGWVLAILAVALGLRHASALHTPQLWAEDGSIFLLNNEADGARALFTPYAGYLHTLPRLIAWTASHVLDVRWWPAFYNWAAFAIWLAVIARTFSHRLPLPAKPWIALTFFLGPQSGEILFNITNLQWITGLALVQTLLSARPTSHAQRIGDAVWLVLIGLTGPFVIILLPLLAWRWWRDRHADNLTLLLLGATCAAIQGWFISHAGASVAPQADGFGFWPTLVVVARRLLVWPAAADHFARDWPPAFIGGVGGLLLVGLLAWALRPDPRRRLRAEIIVALLLMLVAGIIRTRPDTWEFDNLFYGDRYFYIPRVLLAWLLILEFDAKFTWAARTAKALCFLMAVLHLKPYSVPAPPNFDWAGHCDPIRRGVPASIPTLPEGWTVDYPGRPARR